MKPTEKFAIVFKDGRFFRVDEHGLSGCEPLSRATLWTTRELAENNLIYHLHGALKHWADRPGGVRVVKVRVCGNKRVLDE